MRKVLTFILISLILFSFKVTLAREEFIVTNTNSRGAGSFLYAICEAIDKGGVVKFDIPEEDKNFNGKVWVIKLKDPIPEIDKPIIIDGLSQTEKHGDRNPDGPEIVIDASMVVGKETLFYFRKSGFEISGISITNFKGKGVVETKQAKGSVHDVSIRDSNIGLYLYKASGVKIKNVSLLNLKYGLYLYYSNFNTAEDIYVERCDYGIRLYYSMNNEIKDSTVVKCDSGIRVFYNSIKNKIHDNKISKNIDGVWLRDSHNIENYVFSNEFTENTNGFHLLYGTKTQIYSNRFNKNDVGIFIEFFSEKNEIFENSFTDNNASIVISNHSKNNVLRGNVFDSNKKAIFIEEETSIPNTLSENIITNNDYRGIMINSNDKTPPPKILNAGLVGKGIAMEVENEVGGTLEVFLSNYDGKTSPHPVDPDASPYHGDSKRFLGKSSVNSGKETFIIVGEAKEGQYVTTTLTNKDTGTSEFSLNKKLVNLPFLDAILSVSSSTERGERVKFTVKIKNSGDMEIEKVRFECPIPETLEDTKLDFLPDGAEGDVENNVIYVKNIDIDPKSFVTISFSSLIPDSIDVGTKISLQGEVYYYPIDGLLIKEKTDRDEFDDGVPDSDIGDEETEFVILGKPNILFKVECPEEVNANSMFNIKINMKNVGNKEGKNIKLSFNVPNDFSFISSSKGSFNSKEKVFTINILSLKLNEEINVSITLKSKSIIDDKNVSLIFTLKGTDIKPIDHEVLVLVKGEGKENITYSLDFPEEVELLKEFEIRITFTNSGNRESEEKLVKLSFDDGVSFLSSTPEVKAKSGEISYTLKSLPEGKTKVLKLKFKITEGCKGYKKFVLSFNDNKEEFKIFVNCLRVYHHAIISGFPDGSFKPNLPLKRVEASAIITNALLLKPSTSFLPKDILPNYWGSGFVSSVVGSGIMRGYPDGTFKPERCMTRIEASAVIFKILSLREDYSIRFKDVKKDYWGRGIIGAVVKAGVMKGYPDGTFKPDRFITRAEFLVIVLKAIGRGKASFNVSSMFSDVDSNFWAYPFIIEATVPHVVINPEKLGEIRIKDRVFPVFSEKFNSIVEIVKVGDKIKVSLPFLYPDLREVEITVSRVGVKP